MVTRSISAPVMMLPHLAQFVEPVFGKTAQVSSCCIFCRMEARLLKRDVEALIADYIGQKLRENSFDPQGKGGSTVLDDLAHYDLALSVALCWMDKGERRDVLDTDVIGASGSSGCAGYPNRLEREAMILSTFAGMIMKNLPVEEILALYRCKPAASYPNQHSKGTVVYPFTLSYHPFAMLGSYKAVHHSRKHNQKLKRWLSERAKASAQPGRVESSSSSSSSHSFLSESSDEETAEHYEGSQESPQD